MKRSTASIAALIQVTRLALVAAGVSNVWLIVLLSKAPEVGEPTTAALETMPTALALLLAAGMTIGLHVFGTTLNDVLDARHDRMFDPHRPIPAGQFSSGRAVVLSMAALLVAIVCAVPFGPTATVVCLICAAGVLFYDTVGKHFPAAGVVTLGLVRAGQMFVPNPDIAFCWPMWLAMTHIMGISAAAYVLEQKRPKLAGLELWGLIAGWAFWSLGLIGWMIYRHGLVVHDAPSAWLGPIAMVGLFALLAGWRLPKVPRGRDAGRLLMRLGWLWLIAYDAAWLGGVGRWGSAAAVAMLLPLALLLMGMRQWLHGRSDPQGAYRVSSSPERKTSP